MRSNIDRLTSVNSINLRCSVMLFFKMEESKNYGHPHPLLLVSNQDQVMNNQSGVSVMCSRCGDNVSAPCFVCVQDCGFCLHKVCADAPLELNHPFHQNHPLLLMQNTVSNTLTRFIRALPSWFCCFCGKEGGPFMYRCSSCALNSHIRCALFTFNIAENNLKELQHVALQDPLISTEKDDEQLENVRKCFGCWEPLANYTYFSPDCGFNLHKKCAELPLKLNHICHRKHLLVLQFNHERLSCKICQETQQRGFVYCCSPCKFAIQIECLSSHLVPVINDKRHEHPFRLFPRRAPFICDACGTEGTYSAYICCECNIIVHKKCISLPSIIKSKWHDHAIFHNYFLPDDFTSSDCSICHDEVGPEHGSYCCSYCNVAFHVHCVTKEVSSYSVLSREDAGSISNESSITCVLERNDSGVATKVKHFLHDHDLMLSTCVGEHEQSCDGCMLPISDPFYCCSQCDFLLHKVCAELPQMKQVWHHKCQQLLRLVWDGVFRCTKCRHVSNAFAYECFGCKEKTCLRCVVALTPCAHTCSKHEHPLFFYQKHNGRCNACGGATWSAFRCKDCDFTLDRQCFSLPSTARHKCDEHLLSLTNSDDNSYSETHFCDICERNRDPNRWFYRCAACDTSVHIDCVLSNYPFMKLESIYGEIKNHPHPLTFVKKSYYYPDCDTCGKHCQDLALECTQSGCNYILHWKCVAPDDLQRWWW